MACDYFVNAIDDIDFAIKVLECASTTLQEALRVALQIAAWTKDAQRRRGDEESKSDVPKPKANVCAAQPNTNTAQPLAAVSSRASQ